jgi:hypothetical protein
MSYIVDHKHKFENLLFQINNQDQLRKQANGGNSILFSYPPNEEYLYINKAFEIYAEKAEFIDVSQLLVTFIDDFGWADFEAYYSDFQDTSYKVFKSDSSDIDLFDLIINEIERACTNDKLPFLVRTGCLNGTGIENLNIMEHKTVMNLSHPLTIFYPSRIEDDNIYFLNFKPASKYRCILVK